MAKDTFSSLIDLFKTSSSSTLSTLVCDICGNKLSVFKKKKPCTECRRQFCSQCLQRCRDCALRCKNCCVLTMRPLLRSALLDLRVKDLQHYLNQHNVSTRGCLEKEDLVNVLLRYAGNPPAQSGNPPPGNSRVSTGVFSSHREPSSSFNSATTINVNPTSGSDTQANTTHCQTNAPFHASGHGDSDSSSDTSFEMVQRPSSEENITSVHSSSSSTSVSGQAAASRRVTSSSSATTSEGGADQLERFSTVTSARQASIREATPALESIPVLPHVEAENSGIPEVIVESDATQEATRSNNQPSMSQSNSSNNSPNLLRGTMASISSEADFESLSVKQLKDILHRHRVNYHGCCEKAELVDRAKRLYRDYCSSRAELEKLDMDSLCKICMDAPVECVMLECGHMATCTDCGRQLSECPICRQFVVRIVRTFKA